jgi:hypothetical protein
MLFEARDGDDFKEWTSLGRSSSFDICREKLDMK